MSRDGPDPERISLLMKQGRAALYRCGSAFFGADGQKL